MLVKQLFIFEKIKDASGHARFIEGDMASLEEEGVTISFAKWSLSGSHLMLVVAGSIASGTTISAGVFANAYTLPSWIVDKIYPVFISYICNQTFKFYNQSTGQSQDQLFYLRKYEGTTIRIENEQIVAEADLGFRVAFDLLIDNESEE